MQKKACFTVFLKFFACFLQTLTRQLAEARESLECSNRLYEQLEVKLEESEESNRQLQKLHRTTQALLEKKTVGLVDLDKDLVQLRLEREDFYAELDKLRKQVIESTADKERLTSKSPRREKTPAVGHFDGDSVDDDSYESEQEEVTRLRKAVRDLSVKLQSSVSRKKQLEREMEDLVEDNTGLTHTLDKMEGDMSTLHQRLEEARERSVHLLESGVTQEPTPPTTPQQKSFFQSLLTSTKVAPPPPVIASSSTGNSITVATTSSINTASATTASSTDALSKSSSTAAVANEQSLFSELDQEYSGLQDKYQRLLDSCICSVGRTQLAGGSAKTVSTKMNNSLEKINNGSSANSQGKFKELFDELFSTLRETAQVADKLIESRSPKVNRK